MGFKDRCLQHSEAGDQLCGHTVAGLNVNSHEFAFSPPFFLVEDCGGGGSSGEGEEEDTPTEEDVDQAIVTAFGTVPPRHRLLCHFLLASLLRHRQWMRDSIPCSSRVFGSPIFCRGLFDKVHSSVRVCLPWTNNQTLWRITFTGIPPAVTNFCHQREQLELLTKLPDTLLSRIKNLLDERGIGGGDTTIEQLKEILVKPLSERLDLLTGPDSLLLQVKSTPAAKPKTATTFSTLPENYRLNTKLSCLAVWMNWHLGEELKKGSAKSPPWKSLKTSDLARSGSKNEKSTARKTLSNLRSLCLEFDKAASFGCGSRPDAKKLSDLWHQEDSPVQAVLEPLRKTDKGRNRRVAECHWETLATLLLKKQVQKQPERQRSKVQKRKKPAEPGHSATTKKPKKEHKGKPAPPSHPIAVHSESEDENASCHRIHGPIPQHINAGALTLDNKDCSAVQTQGRMIPARCCNNCLFQPTVTEVLQFWCAAC